MPRSRCWRETLKQRRGPLLHARQTGRCCTIFLRFQAGATALNSGTACSPAFLRNLLLRGRVLPRLLCMLWRRLPPLLAPFDAAAGRRMRQGATCGRRRALRGDNSTGGVGGRGCLSLYPLLDGFCRGQDERRSRPTIPATLSFLLHPLLPAALPRHSRASATAAPSSVLTVSPVGFLLRRFVIFLFSTFAFCWVYRWCGRCDVGRRVCRALPLYAGPLRETSRGCTGLHAAYLYCINRSQPGKARFLS